MKYFFQGQYSLNQKNKFIKAQNDDWLKLKTFLQTENNKLDQIKFYIFDTREAKQTADPAHSISRASARFAEFSIYRFWQIDQDPHYPHEITHLVAHTWGNSYQFATKLDQADGSKLTAKIEMLSTSFWQEGLAIVVDELLFQRKLLENNQEKNIDDWCRLQLEQYAADFLQEAINFDGFCSFPNDLVVPFAASLTKFLLKNFGLQLFKQLYVKASENKTPAENIALVEKIYNLNQPELFERWKESLVSS